jgi:hypothetical protein
LDDRQDILGQVSSFQASQPEEAAHGEEEQAAHQRCPTVHSGQPTVFFSDAQQARPPGGILSARQAPARRHNEITKGGVYDE